MKNYTLGYIISFLLLITEANAIDTLFYENFDSWDYIEIEDSIFTDYDEDGMTAANGLPGGWFVANLANGGADTTDVVALSASWLEGYYPGNRIWYKELNKFLCFLAEVKRNNILGDVCFPRMMSSAIIEQHV